MKSLAVVLIVAMSVAAQRAVAAEGDEQAMQLAREVWKASGGENWEQVKTIDFTFIVEQDGQQVASASHHWDVANGTDHVKWKDKDVEVDLSAAPSEGDAKAAYARWVNDSYWLLAPLKLLDPGVILKHEGSRTVDGNQYELLRVSFRQVGLTPGDQYLLYIDPATKLVRAWDYLPKPDTTMHSTWEGYEDFGGLKLATDHDFAGKKIRFTGVKVVRGDQ